MILREWNQVFVAIFGITGGFGLAIDEAWAGVPDAQVNNFGYASVGTDVETNSDTTLPDVLVQVSTPLSGYSSIHAVIQSQPAPSMQAVATATALSLGVSLDAFNSSEYDYYFEIMGPDATVPVLVQANGIAAFDDGSQGRMYATGQLALVVDKASDFSDQIVFDNGLVDYHDGVLSPQNLDGNVQVIGNNLSLSEDSVYYFQTNTVYLVSIAALAQAYANNVVGPLVRLDDTFTTTASIDPTFTLQTDDPAYSLVLSDGVGNAAVPELSTWAMTLAGFGFIALAGGWSRRSRAPAAA